MSCEILHYVKLEKFVFQNELRQTVDKMADKLEKESKTNEELNRRIEELNAQVNDLNNKVFIAKPSLISFVKSH